MERGAVQQNVDPNPRNQDEDGQDRDNPGGYPPPPSALARRNDIRFVGLVRREVLSLEAPWLECLSQSHEHLRSFDAGVRIQVVADVDANRANRGGIAESDAHGVTVERSEIVEADGGKYISAIVKSNNAQPFLDEIERKTHLGIQDQQLVAAVGNGDLGARRRVGRIAASRNHALRAGSVKRKSAQRAAAAGEETLAERHFAAGIGLLQSHPDAVRPDDPFADALVVRGLSQKRGEAEVRAQP